MIEIAESKNPNDILVLPQHPIQLGQPAAIARNGRVAINVETDRRWLRARDRFQQAREKIVRNRKIVFANVALGDFDDCDSRIHHARPSAPDDGFIVGKNFRRLKQAVLTRTGDQGKHAESEQNARHRRIAKC